MQSFNHSIMILSDMPQTQKGSWFLHYKEKMDEELIYTIKATIYEIWKTKERVRRLKGEGKTVPKYLKSYLRTLDTNLNKMRSVVVYYKEYSSIENLQLLGENYIKQMKRDLTPKTFQTSILCQRIGIAKDGFYSSMRGGISTTPAILNTSTNTHRSILPRSKQKTTLPLFIEGVRRSREGV